jgi:hypothetical protein
MKYPVVSASEALRYLSAKRQGVEGVPDPRVDWRGDGEELDTAFVGSLRSGLESLQDKFGNKRTDKENSAFEGQAAVLVHKAIPNEPLMLADFDFWGWLAVVHLPHVVEWRYGSPENGSDLKNYGIGARGENFLYRLWLRAEISLDEGKAQRYHLTLRGQVDFWRSHIFRQGYASVPAMAKALIRFQYPEELNGQPRLKIAEIRALAPRMKRLRANLMYEFLDDAGCLRLLEREAAQLPQVAKRE